MTYDIWVTHGRQRINSVLSYSSAKKLKVGEIVKVPLRSSYGVGVVVSISTKKYPKIKPVASQLGVTLSSQNLQLARWMMVYYPSALSSIISLFLPSLRTFSYDEPSATPTNPPPQQLPTLTKEQQHAVSSIESSQNSHFYLHGITASGKTRVYLELANSCLDAGKSVMILTPEIGLTGPLHKKVTDLFGEKNVVNFHSKLTQKQSDLAWLQVAKNKAPMVIVGPRSALFLPLQHLGLIVLDEAHDGAYKQQQQPFYSATRVAAKLASLWDAKAVFGTATPDIVDYYSFKRKGLPVITMGTTAIKSNFSREDHIIDLSEKSNFKRSSILSEPLIKAVEQAIRQGKQSLLFLNRRGSAKTIACNDCGWRLTCPNCDIGLTYHSDHHSSMCHHCSYQQKVPTICPECHQADIMFQTPGTKALETELIKLFPNARIARFDKDVKAGQRLDQLHTKIEAGEIDILIGTQMLAKGLDISHLSVVGVVQADISMSMPDFSSTEKSYQLISQVAGRLNRGHGHGKLYIQTFSPDSPVIQAALSQDYQTFYKKELSQRLEFGFPPAYYMLQVISKRKTANGAKKSLQKIHDSLQNNNQLKILPVSPCFIEKQSGKYCWQMIIKSKNRSRLTDIMKKLPTTVSANIDPTDLL